MHLKVLLPDVLPATLFKLLSLWNQKLSSWGGF